MSTIENEHFADLAQATLGSMGNDRMNIRRADASDCAALTELMHESSAYHGAYAAILSGYSVSPEQVDTNHVYVVEEGQRILGFYSLATAADETELDLLFVRDAAQGHGIGAQLFRHMKALAASSGASNVTIVSHPPAEAFYRRMGAVRIGTRPASGNISWPRPILSLDPDKDSEDIRRETSEPR